MHSEKDCASKVMTPPNQGEAKRERKKEQDLCLQAVASVLLFILGGFPFDPRILNSECCLSQQKSDVAV